MRGCSPAAFSPRVDWGEATRHDAPHVCRVADQMRSTNMSHGFTYTPFWNLPVDELASRARMVDANLDAKLVLELAIRLSTTYEALIAANSVIADLQNELSET